MDISTLISASRRIHLSAEESKIPWDEPAFSQRMLANHLSQDHDWASRRRRSLSSRSSGSPASYPLAHISSISAAAPVFIPTA
ncbi:hypothetical protein ACMGOD_005528 [Klebsiella oxytoca]